MSDAELDGLERLRSGLATAGASVPFGDFCKMSLVDAGPGWATRSLRLPPWLAQLADSALPGAQSVVADSALGNAVLSTLPPCRVNVTAELRLELVRAATFGDPILVCEARVVDVDDNVALSNGVVRDGSGATVALATMWSAIIQRAAGPPTAGTPPVPAPPVRTPMVGTIIEMLDIDETDDEGGSVVLCVPPRAELANSLGFVHGGAVSMLADVACATLVRRTIAAQRVRHLHHQIQYFRPTPMIGHTEYRARLVEQSRRFATLDCLIIDGRGATTARASQLMSVTQER